MVALIGPGNNGGDALYAAAHLAERGHHVVCVRSDWPVHEGGLAAARLADVGMAAPGRTGSRTWPRRTSSSTDSSASVGGPALPPQVQPWVDAIPDTAYVLAVDLPSGQDPSGGAVSPDAVFADETVTFGVAKPVHLLPATEPAVGRLTVVDIGLTVEAVPGRQRLTRDDVPRLWPVPGAGDDKYSRGVLGVLAGGEQYTGAAVLCCTAAVCSGAGWCATSARRNPRVWSGAASPRPSWGRGRCRPGLSALAWTSRPAVWEPTTSWPQPPGPLPRTFRCSSTPAGWTSRRATAWRPPCSPARGRAGQAAQPAQPRGRAEAGR